MVFLKERFTPMKFYGFMILPSVWVWVSVCFFLLRFSLILAVYLYTHLTLKIHPFFRCRPHLWRIQNRIYMQVFQIYHCHDYLQGHIGRGETHWFWDLNISNSNLTATSMLIPIFWLSRTVYISTFLKIFILMTFTIYIMWIN